MSSFFFAVRKFYTNKHGRAVESRTKIVSFLIGNIIFLKADDKSLFSYSYCLFYLTQWIAVFCRLYDWLNNFLFYSEKCDKLPYQRVETPRVEHRYNTI